MSKKLNVQCYECKTVYELEPEMVGEAVECAVCNTVFVIPDTTPDVESDIVETNSQAIVAAGGEQGSDEAGSTTSSTKLSTKTIKLNMAGGRGMIPLVEDKFGVDDAHPPKQIEKSADILNNFKKSQTKFAKEALAPKSHWWQLGRKKKKK